MLLYDERYSVGKNNKIIFKKHVLAKVLAEGGKSLNTVSLPFDGYSQKFKINIARTIQPNGDIVNVAPEATTEESPYSNLPMYSDFKIKKMTFPAVAVGSVMEYEVEYTTDNKNVPGLFALFTIPLNSTLLLARFTVEVPKNTIAKFNAVRVLNPQPKIESFGSKDIYSWEMSNVWVGGGGQVLLPAYMKFGPYISFSTIKSWEDVYKYCKRLIGGQAEPDESIKLKAKELSQGIENNRAKIIKRFYEYASQDIQYVAIEWGLSAFRPYPAADVLQKKYGDCKGKSGLLIAMLKSVGIPAHFALVATVPSGFIEPEIPSVFFNHAIVAVPDGNSYMFMDPTADMLSFNRVPFSVQGADALILGDTSLVLMKIPSESAEENKTNSEISIHINEDGSMQVYSESKYTGQDAWLQRNSAKYVPLKQYNELLQKALSTEIPNITLKDVKTAGLQDLDNPFSINIIAEARNYARKSGASFVFKVPCYLGQFFTMIVAGERRDAPLFILYPRTMDMKTIVKIPVRYGVKYVPQNASFDTPVISYSIVFENKDSEIIITEKLVLKEAEISEGKYPRFKNVIDKIRGIYNENIVLEQKQVEKKSTE
jgi:hypothetical protein